MDKRLELHLAEKVGRPTEYDDEKHKARAEYMRKWYEQHREAVRRYRQKPGSKEKRRIYRQSFIEKPESKAKRKRYAADLYARQKAADPDFVLTRYVKKYGLDADSYRAMLAKQEGHCATCSGEVGRFNTQTGKHDRLYVDHDHSTGAVRGILCVRCNFILGHAHDDPELLRRIANYLER